MILTFTHKVVIASTTLLLVIIFYPYQDPIYHDIATIGGHPLLAIMIYLLFLVLMTTSTRTTTSEDIEAGFAHPPSSMVLEQKSEIVYMNYLELRVDGKEIRVQTLPDFAKARIAEMRRAMTLGGILSPGISFGIFSLRRLVLPTETMLLNFMTGILYLAFLFVTGLLYLAFQEVPDESRQLFHIIKRGDILEITTPVTNETIKKDSVTKDMVLRIPRDRLHEELYLSSVSESLDQSSDELSIGARILHKLAKKLYVFPRALTVDLESEHVEVLQQPERKENQPDLLTSNFLMFGVHDPEIVHALQLELVNWVDSS